MGRIVSIILAAILCSSLTAQEPRPAFEVVSIKPTPPGTEGGGFQLAPGGRLTWRNTTLKGLVAAAYQRFMWDSREIVGGPDWFNDPMWAMPALIVLGVWPLGVETLAFLAGLKEIPQDLLDAAAVDGAQGWQKLRHVILPLISPVILFNLVIGVIYSFQVFTQALVIGGFNGEPLESTLMFLVLIYRNAFRYFSMGYAAALSVILFLAVLVLTLLIFRSSRAWVHYEGGQR